MNKVTNITDSKLNQAQQEIAHLKSLLLDAYTNKLRLQRLMLTLPQIIVIMFDTHTSKV